jgi:nucleotide-binding universal stress UspA family protein
MTMFQRILVVFENEEIFDEAVTYTRELALRMDSEVTLLMLVEMAFLDRSFLGSKRNSIMRLEERMGKIVTSLSGQFAKEGIFVSAALRVGDPAEELLKFLAGKPPFQALIWGSGRDLPESGQFRRGHWVGKVAGTLECPLLTVSNREQPLTHAN